MQIDAPTPCEVAGCVAEGIDAATGAYRTDSTDLIFPAGLFAIEVQRSYSSGDERAGWFGQGWATVYETSVTETDDVITIDAPAGLAPRWTPEAPAGWDVAGALSLTRIDGGGFRVDWPTGESWKFATDGTLVRMSSPYGDVVDLDYGPDRMTISSSQGVELTADLDDERIVHLSTDDGRKIDYEYTDDRLTSVEAPGLSIQYRHNADGLVVDQVLAAGTTTVEYDGDLAVAQRTASGHQFKLSYDDSNTVVESIDGTASYEHDALGRLVRVSRGEQAAFTQTFDDEGRLTERVTRALPSGDTASSIERQYSEDGKVEAVTVDGVRSTYEYDDRGRVTAVAGATNAEFEYSGEAPLPTAVTTPATGRRDLDIESGFTVAVTDETGATVLTRRDALGNPVATGFGPDALWKYEFDPEGNITSSTSAMGREWKSTWAPRSRLLSEHDPIGRVSSYDYDDAGRTVREMSPDGTSTYEYTSRGQLAEVVAPDGTATRYEYAANGHLAAIIESGERSWRISQEVAEDGSSHQTTVAPDGTTVEESVDSSGRVVDRRSIEADGTLTERVAMRYDSGRRIETVTTRGSSVLTETVSYDPAGRATAEARSLDGVEIGRTTYEFEDGRAVRVSAGDETTSYSYDPAGRLIGVDRGDEEWAAIYRDGRVTSVDRGDGETRVAYDPDGRATTFIESDGTQVDWTYDDVDRPVERRVADVPATFAWNDADDLVRYTSSTGAVWAYAYDDGGRLSDVREPGEIHTGYEYENGAVVRIRTEGPGIDRDDRFTFDARGLLATADTERGDFEYSYDSTGLVHRVKSPAGDETWTLDAVGNAIMVTAGEDQHRITYSGTGQVESIDGPDDNSVDVDRVNGAISTIDVDHELSLGLAVDERGRLSSIDWGDDTVVDVSWQSSENFSTGTRGEEERYGYTVSDGRLVSFAADGSGFRASTQPSGLLDELRLSGEAVGTVQFDQLGRPATLKTEDRVSSITYDPRGRVSSIITTEAGEDIERTTVAYPDGKQEIEGDDELVEALFDESGGPRQSLPGGLPNPVSSAVDEAVLNGASLVRATDPLTDIQPDPLKQISTAVDGATPELVSAIGVRDRERLAKQLLVAEVNRLSPTIAVNGADRIRVPIIDPDTGEATGYNPFVDAAPSGLALGELARQGGDGGSLIERAVDTLGDIVGGTVSIVGDVARFVVTNPLARSTLVTASAIAGAVSCPSSAGLLCAAAIALLLGDAVTTVASAVPAAWSTCGSLEGLSCGFELARIGLAVGQVWFAGRLVSGITQVAAARTVYEQAEGTARSIASGRLGTAKSELRAVTRFERVIGREVPTCVSFVCARADLAVKRPFGRPALVEVKNGVAARFTPNQLNVYPAMADTPVFLPLGITGKGGPETLLTGVPRVEHWGSQVGLQLP